MWDLIDKFGTIVGLFTAIPVIWSWIILRGYRLRQKEIIESIKSNPGDRPIALAISVAKGNEPLDISNPVRVYLVAEKMKMDVEHLSLPALTANNTSEFVAELRKMRARLIEKGVGQTHLFYMGPVVGALLTGDVFSNGAVRIYYHNHGTGQYEKWGPLTHPVT